MYLKIVISETHSLSYLEKYRKFIKMNTEIKYEVENYLFDYICFDIYYTMKINLFVNEKNKLSFFFFSIRIHLYI